MTALQQAKLKSKVLEELATNPIVEAACRKVSLPRSTYYRWRQADEEFAREVDKALENGRDRINDMAESQLIKRIGGGDLPTIKFWLMNNRSDTAQRKQLRRPNPITVDQYRYLRMFLELNTSQERVL